MKQVVIIVGMLALAIDLSGQGKGKGKGKQAHEGHGASASAPAAVFSGSDRSVIEQWVRAQPARGLPPGLAKRGSLPPGLQKQLQRNGTLPPGLQKKLSPFPVELARRLEPLPQGCGCERAFVEGRAMILVRGTGVILDVFSLF